MITITHEQAVKLNRAWHRRYLYMGDVNYRDMKTGKPLTGNRKRRSKRLREEIQWLAFTDREKEVLKSIFELRVADRQVRLANGEPVRSKL